jgi:integration host factor subunit alpha
VRQHSNIEELWKIGECRFADASQFHYGAESESGKGGGRNSMADLGIARIGQSGLNGTLTRADLADVVHRNLGLSRAESASFVERVLHHMCHALAQGQNVKISGFGSFILRDKGQRIGRNPKTGLEVPIAPRRVMTFRASQILRDRIAK